VQRDVLQYLLVLQYAVDDVMAVYFIKTKHVKGASTAFENATVDAGRRDLHCLNREDRRPIRRRERPTLHINVGLQRSVLQIFSRSRSTKNRASLSIRTMQIVDAGRRDLHCLDREDRRQISSSRLTYNRQRCLRRRVLLRNGSTKKEHVSVHTRGHVLTQDPNNRTTRMNQFMR